MKNRFAIINLGFAIAVLFSILFQSFHSFEHLEKQLSEKQCHHRYHSDSEITHQHHNFDHCYVCEFTFSNFISPVTFFHEPQLSTTAIPYFFTKTQTRQFFSGSSYSLRGPPAFIV
jgi:hypothetical protein